MKCCECNGKLIVKQNVIDYDECVKHFPCGGLVIVSILLRDFTFQTLSINDFIPHITKML